MAFFLMSLRTKSFKPENPKVYDLATRTDNNIAFVDFVPGMVARSNQKIGQTEATVEFHTFGEMIKTANQWLRSNVIWEAIGAEMVTILHKIAGENNDVKKIDVCFSDFKQQNSCFIRALRLWVKRRDNRRKISENIECCQTLNYIDFKPELQSEYSDKFETIEETLKRANEAVENGEICGKIIAADLMPCEANRDWEIDTEIAVSPNSSKYLINLRVIFDESSTTTTNQVIALQDFVPRKAAKTGIFSKPRFESVKVIVRRAKNWLANNYCVERLIYAKTFLVRLKANYNANCTSMSYTIPGDFLKIYRLLYIKTSDDENENKMPLYTSFRIFLPFNKKETVYDCNRRMQEDIRKALQDTIDENEKQHIVCETLNVICKNANDSVEEECEQTFIRHTIPVINGYVCNVFRVLHNINEDLWKTLEEVEKDDENGEFEETSSRFWCC